MWSEQLEKNADTFTTEAVKGTNVCCVLYSFAKQATDDALV